MSSHWNVLTDYSTGQTVTGLASTGLLNRCMIEFGILKLLGLCDEAIMLQMRLCGDPRTVCISAREHRKFGMPR